MRHYQLKPGGPKARPAVATDPAAAGRAAARKERGNTPGPLTGPLSNEQKARICILARQGFDLVVTDLDLQAWRRAQQLAACGKESLTACTQEDFLKLKSHFQKLAGEEGDSLRTANREAGDPARVALFKLREAMTERGLSIGYAINICRTQYKCTLEQASAKQLWCLVYTIRNRRKPTAK
jgi:hypothetical protein